MSTVAIILARGNSKTIPRKNMKLLGNKPLLQYTIEAAIGTTVGAIGIDDVYVSSEDEEICAFAKDCGVKYLKRPDGLSADFVQSNEVFLFAYRQLQELRKTPDTLILLMPTVPFRNTDDILGAYDIYLKRQYSLYPNYNCVLSVSADKTFHWEMDGGYGHAVYQTFPRLGRQWIKEKLYVENGAIYVVNAEMFSLQCTYWLPPFGLYVMPEERSIDINTEYDFWLCERYLEWFKQQA